MVSHPETGSDSPIGSDRDRGRHSKGATSRIKAKGGIITMAVRIMDGGMMSA